MRVKGGWEVGVRVRVKVEVSVRVVEVEERVETLRAVSYRGVDVCFLCTVLCNVCISPTFSIRLSGSRSECHCGSDRKSRLLSSNHQNAQHHCSHNEESYT